MKNIFINGLNSKVGGGKSILSNFLALLLNSEVKFVFYVLVPNNFIYLENSNPNIKIIKLPIYFENQFVYPFLYFFYLGRLMRKLNIEVVLNLGDIPIRSNKKQILLFDWPYAVYPESIVWEKMDFLSLFFRKIKLFFFKYNLNYIDLLLAQSETIKNRLNNIYGFEDIKVIPNAVSLDNLVYEEKPIPLLPDGVLLLYLTHYYPHKNLEIFIPVAKIIKIRKLPFKIILTIDGNQHPKAKKFLFDINDLDLTDVIFNIGPVTMEQVPTLYKKCQALVMPTLLESFSGTYVEAMYHKIPIFTSDLDFALDVCRNSAIYFNPSEATSIIDNLEFYFNNLDLLSSKVSEGISVLSVLPNWETTFKSYLFEIENILKK